jgi:hypothetical protein
MLSQFFTLWYNVMSCFCSWWYNALNWFCSWQCNQVNCSADALYWLSTCLYAEWCVCCRDRSPSWHDWDGAPVGTVRERTRRLRPPLPAATLCSTGRSAHPALPATCARPHQPRPTPELAHEIVLRYSSEFRAGESERGDREGWLSPRRAASCRQANGHASAICTLHSYGDLPEGLLR